MGSLVRDRIGRVVARLGTAWEGEGEGEGGGFDEGQPPQKESLVAGCDSNFLAGLIRSVQPTLFSVAVWAGESASRLRPGSGLVVSQADMLLHGCWQFRLKGNNRKSPEGIATNGIKVEKLLACYAPPSPMEYPRLGGISAVSLLCSKL